MKLVTSFLFYFILFYLETGKNTHCWGSVLFGFNKRNGSVRVLCSYEKFKFGSGLVLMCCVFSSVRFGSIWVLKTSSNCRGGQGG